MIKSWSIFQPGMEIARYKAALNSIPKLRRFMSILVTLLFILTACLLIGVILIQQPKTAGGLFSGTGQSLLGTSGKSFWTKFTTVLACLFMALCLLMSLIRNYSDNSNSVTNLIEKQQQQQQQAPPPSAASASVPGASKPQAPANPGPQPQDLSKAAPSSSGDSKK